MLVGAFIIEWNIFSGLGDGVAESIPLRGVPVDFSRAACVPKILRLENFQAVLIPSSGINLCERRCAKTAILDIQVLFIFSLLRLTK